MSITKEFRDDERLVIVKLVGDFAASEIEALNRDDLMPFYDAHKPEIIDIIWDIREFEWSFSQFVEFLSYARKRRGESSTPLNIRQHYVGQNQWIQNFRTWMLRNFNEQTTAFTNMEDALDYVKKLKTGEAGT